MSRDPLERALIEIALGSPWFGPALEAVRALRLASWCVGAGAVRNLVWDHLHGFTRPTELSDVDVAFFDTHDLSPENDTRLEDRLRVIAPGLPWEVTNQAAVHLWYERYFGTAVEPLPSLEAAVGTWPETATSVGLTVSQKGAVRVIAPCGLEDLFAMIVRRNPTRVSLEVYRQRIAIKRYSERWPRVTILP